MHCAVLLRLSLVQTIEGRQLKYRIPTDGEDEDGEQCTCMLLQARVYGAHMAMAVDVSLTLAIGAREEKLDLTVPENANVRDLQTAIAERMCQDRHGMSASAYMHTGMPLRSFCAVPELSFGETGGL